MLPGLFPTVCRVTPYNPKIVAQVQALTNPVCRISMTKAPRIRTTRLQPDKVRCQPKQDRSKRTPRTRRSEERDRKRNIRGKAFNAVRKTECGGCQGIRDVETSGVRNRETMLENPEPLLQRWHGKIVLMSIQRSLPGPKSDSAGVLAGPSRKRHICSNASKI